MAAPLPAPLPNADLTGRQLGRYEVLLQLASGGMATVYVARRGGVAGFERLVAIKVLHPHLAHDEDFISMFLDEARLAARIRHPNVVATLDISDTQGDGYFLVMDYVEGDHHGNLLRAAARGGERLPVPVTARIVMDALAGLSAAHTLTDADGSALNLVHRDLSPHNLLVDTDGIARITDFGVAKAQVRLSSTRDGQFKGKLSYMAPEQAANGQADQRSDLFSMGIVLWESLTGRRLFRGENNADVLNKILNPQVPAPSQLDPALASFDKVVKKALAREPDMRFKTAEDFLEAVEEAAAAAGGVATPRAVGREVKRWLGEKVQNEKAAIRGSIDALGRNELTPGVLPRPMESGSQPVGPMTPSGADATMGARPSVLRTDLSEPPPAGGGAKTMIALAAIVLLFLLGGGVGAWALFGRGEEPTPSVGAPTSTPAPTAAPDPAEPSGADTAPGAVEALADDEVETDELADDGTDEATDEAIDEAEDRPRRRGRRARRARREQAREQARERARAQTQAEPEPEPEPEPSPTTGRGSGSNGSGADDDLMLNPYRR